MAKLDDKERGELPKDDFGLPTERKYPMENASHAANAKARAKQQLDKGHITTAEYKEIVAKADKILHEKHHAGSKLLSK